MGDAAPAEATHSDEGVEGILQPAAVLRYTGECAETPWQITGEAERWPLWTGEALPGHKEDSLEPVQPRKRASTVQPDSLPMPAQS